MKNNSSDLHEGTKARKHEGRDARRASECRDARRASECRGARRAPESTKTIRFGE
ncbi:MAG: hypothetical protein LBF89_08920 [Bacteroidales bacterium]|nr:hypothetical protein [Bacteroidales bacterium]